MTIPASTGVVLGLMFGYDIATSAFLGLALSVTSIAVTARTLLDLEQLDSRIGHRIVGAAVVDDIVGFVGFALLLIAVVGGDSTEFVTTIGNGFRDSKFGRGSLASPMGYSFHCSSRA